MNPRIQPAEPKIEPLRAGGGESADERALAILFAVPPMPPLPTAAARERVWRQLTEPRRPRQVQWLVFAAAFACVALAFLVWRPSAAGVQLLAANGAVRFSEDNETWRVVGDFAHLPAGGWFGIGPGERALVKLPGVAALLLEDGAKVWVEPQERGYFLRLLSGKLTARVTKRPPDGPFVVQTDRVRVTVVGTLFSVEQDADGRTAVSVREGTVEVEREPPRSGSAAGSSGHSRVTAGRRWSSKTPESLQPDQTNAAIADLLETALYGSPSEIAPAFQALSGQTSAHVTAEAAEQSTPSLNAPLTAESPRISQPDLPAQAAKNAKRSQNEHRTPAGGAPEHGHRSAKSQKAVLTPPTAATDPLRVRETPHVGQTIATPQQLAVSETPPSAEETRAAPAPEPATASPPHASEDPYENGIQLRTHGNLLAAANMFERASTESRHAELALFALGRLSAHELHDPDRARAAFLDYRKRFPAGMLVQEVDFELFDLEVSTGNAAAAQREADYFLAAHPQSERSDEILEIRGNLLQAQGLWAEALGSYRAVHRPLREEAAFLRADCLRKTKDAKADAALREYLARFPQGQHSAAAKAALRSNAEERREHL